MILTYHSRHLLQVAPCDNHHAKAASKPGYQVQSLETIRLLKFFKNMAILSAIVENFPQT